MSDYEKPCPFCGSTNLKSGGDDKIVGTWCLECQARGPNHYGRYEWNDRADRIEELSNCVAVLKAKLTNQTHMIAQVFALLDITEETDDGRVFHPNRISSCRALDAEKLNQGLKELKNTLEDWG